MVTLFTLLSMIIGSILERVSVQFHLNFLTITTLKLDLLNTEVILIVLKDWIHFMKRSVKGY